MIFLPAQDKVFRCDGDLGLFWIIFDVYFDLLLRMRLFSMTLANTYEMSASEKVLFKGSIHIFDSYINIFNTVSVINIKAI